jgi:hypothetical protein
MMPALQSMLQMNQFLDISVPQQVLCIPVTRTSLLHSHGEKVPDIPETSLLK